MKMAIYLSVTALIAGMASASLAEPTPSEQARQAAAQAMAKAQADKARNDQIVQQQRAAEAAAAKARSDTQNVESACKKARTC